MNGINVSVNISVDFSESTKAFIAQLLTSAKPAPAAPAAPTAPAAPAAKPAPAAPAAANITIEQVRQALAQKVNNHREEIKSKLNELGAPSVTKLDPAKYSDMLTFLNGLA